MSKYQLCSRDEYGQMSILATSEDVNEVIEKGKKEVTNLNVNNALTSDDRARSWESYLVYITSGKNKKSKYIYGGPYSHAKDTIYKITSKETSTVKLSEIENPVIKIYLGNISPNRNIEEDWFATNLSGKKEINDLDDDVLNGKTMFFVKEIK